MSLVSMTWAQPLRHSSLIKLQHGGNSICAYEGEQAVPMA